MADRVYPASKPNNPHSLNGVRGGAPPTTTTNGVAAAAPPTFPATKSQIYGARRPAYRPQAPPPRRRRSCCCSFCLWLTLLLIALILLCAIAGGVVYVIYRPHRPTFTVSSLRLSLLNVTAAGKLTSRLDLAVTARNPNRKIVFAYDPATISVSTDGDVGIGGGSFPAFVLGTENTTLLKTTVSSASGQTLDSATAADLKAKRTVPLKIELETKAGLKIGGVKTTKIRIRVTCDGISVPVPVLKAKGKAADAAATSPDASCKVKLRIKIWKWTV